MFTDRLELGLFPHHVINIVTPNIFEMKAMFAAAQEHKFFESTKWWSVLDNFGITSQFRQGISFVI
jgi:pseudouridylate synthase / pseudouridine kinase